MFALYLAIWCKMTMHKKEKKKERKSVETKKERNKKTKEKKQRKKRTVLFICWSSKERNQFYVEMK